MNIDGEISVFVILKNKKLCYLTECDILICILSKYLFSFAFLLFVRMERKNLCIGYISLSENFIKIALSFAAVLWGVLGNRDIGKSNYSIKYIFMIYSSTEKLNFGILTILSVIGVFCALRLIAGIKRNDVRYFWPWLIFQCFSIAYKIGCLFVDPDIAETYIKPYELIAAMLYAYILLEVYFLFAMSLSVFTILQMEKPTDNHELVLA